MDNDVYSQENMESMAALMREALESPEGMQALAAAIAAPIESEIKRKEISSLLLTKHVLPKGERPVYQKKPRVKAHWISKGEAEKEVANTWSDFPPNAEAGMPEPGFLRKQDVGAKMRGDGAGDRQGRG